jgi:hypothetical protein
VHVEEGFAPDASTEGAFVLGDRAGMRLGGLDRTGRALAAVDSIESDGAHRRELAAARECLRRRLPEGASRF